MNKIKFSKRAMPVLPEVRPIYKVSQLVLILSTCSRSNKSSLMRLHLLNWLIADSSRVDVCFSSKIPKFPEVWGVDPMLNIAIQLAISEGLIEKNSSGFELTVYGIVFAKAISAEKELGEELSVYEKIGKQITEKKITELVNKWK